MRIAIVLMPLRMKRRICGKDILRFRVKKVDFNRAASRVEFSSVMSRVFVKISYRLSICSTPILKDIPYEGILLIAAL
jgi:hypothetical protein